MIHMIGQAFLGLVVGVLAKLLLPGWDPGGLFVTAGIGLVGGWLSGRTGKALGWYDDGHTAGIVASIVGAMVLLLVYRLIA